MISMSTWKKVLLIVIFSSWTGVSAQVVNVDASKLVRKPEITLSPRSGSFVEGSTFDVPILLNTNGVNINSLEVRLNFDKNKLEIVRPTGSESIIGVWIEPPRFDNKNGNASYVGVVTNGITTNSGLIGTVTFKAKSSGRAVVYIGSDSKVLINDGLGTEIESEFGRAEYSILVKPPEGVRVYSDTHPFQGQWYNNNSPTISWDKDLGVEGFSYTIDNIPSTVPSNEILTQETTKSYENLTDGLWYFHIKARKNGAWSATGHFLIRVDTRPPAEFRPNVSYLSTRDKIADKTLISFVTTDNLSGIERYEVGVIDKADSSASSPIFVSAESPYQVPIIGSGYLNVIVRAVDGAGNVVDVSVDIEPQTLVGSFFRSNWLFLIIVLLVVAMTGFITNYFVGHHVLRHFKRAVEFIKRDSQTSEVLPSATNDVSSNNNEPNK